MQTNSFTQPHTRSRSWPVRICRRVVFFSGTHARSRLPKKKHLLKTPNRFYLFCSGAAHALCAVHGVRIRAVAASPRRSINFDGIPASDSRFLRLDFRENTCKKFRKKIVKNQNRIH